MFGDVDQVTAQGFLSVFGARNTDKVAQPDGVAVRGDHAILKFILGQVLRRFSAEVNGEVDVFRMKVLDPEVFFVP